EKEVIHDSVGGQHGVFNADGVERVPGAAGAALKFKNARTSVAKAGAASKAIAAIGDQALGVTIEAMVKLPTSGWALAETKYPGLPAPDANLSYDHIFRKAGGFRNAGLMLFGFQ